MTIPFPKGTLDVLVLKALMWGPMHGFELSRWLDDRSAEAFALNEAAIYQALYRLEARRLVAAVWGLSEQGKRARYYSLTASGKAQLRQQTADWRKYATVVSAILDAKPA